MNQNEGRCASQIEDHRENRHENHHENLHESRCASRRENHRESLPYLLLVSLASTAHCASRASHPLTNRRAEQTRYLIVIRQLWSAVRCARWSVEQQSVNRHFASHRPYARLQQLYRLESVDQDHVHRGVRAPRHVAGHLCG